MARRRSTKKTESKTAGRPRGSRTQPRDVVPVQPSRCKRCGSTEREPYSQTTTRNIRGRNLETGALYNVVKWSRTRCKSCGQARVDQVFELVGETDPAAETAEN